MVTSINAVRLDALTGVRILAAAGVFLNHVTPPESVSGPLRVFAAAGYNGVTLFFILSGFVLTWNYADRLVPLRPGAVWSFFVARFARIYPLYLFALLCAVAPKLVTTGVKPTIWLHVFGMQAWAPDIFTAMAFNSPAWSVSVEIFLYASFPLLIVALMRLRRSRRGLLAVAVACLLVGVGLAWWFTATGRAALVLGDNQSAHHWLYRMPLTRLGDFIVGMVAALLIRTGRPRASVAAAAQLTGAVGFVTFMAWPAMFITAWSWDVAYLVPGFLLLWGLAAGEQTGFARFLASRPMVLAGEASFAFYLLHRPLLRRLEFEGVDTLPGWLFTTGLQFAVILLVAVGAHVVIEVPVQRWLRKTLDRTRAPAVLPAIERPRHALV